MALYAEGDGAAFRRLFELMAPRIRAFFLRSFSDAAVADDLTQATFLKLHSARVSYRADRPLKPWVFTIAAGIRCDELRRRYRLPRHIGEGDLDVIEAALMVEPLVEDQSNDLSRAEAVRAAIKRLPESQRVVVHLHRYEELTFEQIAEVLGTTPGAVRVRASRAYEQLREELRAYITRKS